MLNVLIFKKSVRAVIGVLTIMLVVGCAGKGNKKSKTDTAKSTTSSVPLDITRPPVVIGAQRDVTVESNPDETISFEEWKRRQTEQSADSDE